MPPRDLAQVEGILRKVACPVCGGGKIELSGKKTTCKTCGFTFDIETDLDRLFSEEPRLADRLKKTECPDCGKRGGGLLCRCDPASGDSFHIICCPACGFPYKEAAEIKKPRR
jgi:rubredoxin